MQKCLHLLSSQNLAEVNGEKINLTKKGKEEALRLVRAHRLWETFLVDQIGLTAEQIHEDAEKYEHLLSEEILDEVDATLGFPQKDPHGSPIPSKVGFPEFAMSKLQAKQTAIIAHQQVDDHITTQLWKMGILPNSSFILEKKEQGQVYIRLNNNEIAVPMPLAQQVNVELA